MSQRLQQLESSLQFQKFVHDVEEELNWIKEREHQSSSNDLGSNLSGVQQLVKKHQVDFFKKLLKKTDDHWISWFWFCFQSLIDELRGHEESVNTLVTEGDDLVKDGHFATREINERLNKLNNAWDSLNKQAKQRTTSLNDSLKLQQVQ